MRSRLIVLFIGLYVGCGPRVDSDIGRTNTQSSSLANAKTQVNLGHDLTGKWEVVSLLKNAKEAKPAGAPIVIEFRDGWQIMTQSGTVIDESKFTVDESTTPKSIDSIPNARAGNTTATLGIYEINGNELRLCMAAGKPRPAALESNDTYNLTILKRAD